MIFYFRLRLLAPVTAIDGDTLAITTDHGMGWRWDGELRLDGVDAPELHSKSTLEAQAGTAVKGWCQAWVIRWLPSWVASTSKPEKFGRLLGDLYIECPAFISTRSLCKDLLAHKLVRVYHGEKKLPWSDDELTAIIEAAKFPP